MPPERLERPVSPLLISVTERCDPRCSYCTYSDRVSPAGHGESLSFEEIVRIVHAGTANGFSKVRLTGGEPTLRTKLPQLVAMINEIPGIDEISMTTTGVRLSELSKPLKKAGLDRVDISLDTLRRERNRELIRRVTFPAVLKGIENAVDVGFATLSFNSVILRGINDDELFDLADFARKRNAQMLFISYLPIFPGRASRRYLTVSISEMLERLRRRFDLEVESISMAGPPSSWVCRQSGARIAFTTTSGRPPQSARGGMHLTAKGQLKSCSHRGGQVDLKAIFRRGGSDRELTNSFRRAMRLNRAGHSTNAFASRYSNSAVAAGHW